MDQARRRNVGICWADAKDPLEGAVGLGLPLLEIGDRFKLCGARGALPVSYDFVDDLRMVSILLVDWSIFQRAKPLLVCKEDHPAPPAAFPPWGPGPPANFVTQAVTVALRDTVRG